MSSPAPALIAKFHRPAPRQHAIARPAHVARLNAGLAAGRQVTLISAPAGYGKTTLAAEWAAQLDRPAAWLSLDEADDDLLRFCTYFVAALQRADPALGAALAPALEGGQLPSQAALVSTLLNDLNAAAPAGAALVCVLDDFHVIQDPAILSILESLLAHGSTALHLALVTREDPALPLARLRARDQLTEVRAADLRFDLAETAAFLRAGMGLHLSETDLAHLAERTEGWAAGLQLAGLSLQGRGDPSAFVETLSGSHRFILGYLTEEVLARQPADVQQFLLDTSILARLSGDLCDAVAGRSDSTALLERLLAANLFLIPLDDEGRWYRYHHLFAELLRTHLRRTHPERVAELHRRAGQWHEAHAMPVEAIEYSMASGHNQRAAALLEAHGWALLNQGYTRKMEAWLQSLPPDLRAHSPRVCLGFAWMHLLRGSFPQSLSYVQQAEAALAGLAPDTAVRALRAECLALQANLYQVQGHSPASVEAAHAALGLMSPQDTRLAGLAWLALGGAYRQSAGFDQAVQALEKSATASQQSQDWVTWMLAISHLTLLAVQHGRLGLAIEAASQAIEQVQRLGIVPPPIIGSVYGGLGLAVYEVGQVEAGRKYLLEGIRLGTFSGHNASLVYTRVHLARLLQGEGNLEAAARALEEAAALLRLGAPGWARPDLVYRQVSLALARGDPAAAEAVLRQSGVAADDEITRRSDWIHLAWLRWLVAWEDPAARKLAERLVGFAEADQRDGTTLQALILGALAGGGSHWLLRALALGERQGYLRIFVDEGVPLADLLRWVPATAYVRRLLACFPAQPAGAVPSRPEGLIEPLSERELEVLRLLAEGLRYGEIAERLVVSLNTVRFHVKEIYGKLGVNRQAQAVARARELGLL